MNTISSRVAIAILGVGIAACTPKQTAQPTQPPPQQPARDPQARPEFDLGPDALEARVKELTDGYLAMEVGQGDLGKFKPLELQLTRGLCYVAVLRLGSGAAFGPHARRGVKVVTAFELDDIVENDSAIVGPGAILDSGCPLVDGHLVVDLQATFDAETNARRFHELGSGSYTWTLYSAPITEKELAALKGQTTTGNGGGPGGRPRSVAATPASRADAVVPPKKDAPVAARAIALRNECPTAAKFFFGPDPSSSSGPPFAIKSGGVVTKEFRAGDRVWLLDSGGMGVGLVTVTDAVREITVSKDCFGIAGK